jgi:hypothetical protein
MFAYVHCPMSIHETKKENMWVRFQDEDELELKLQKELPGTWQIFFFY